MTRRGDAAGSGRAAAERGHRRCGARRCAHHAYAPGAARGRALLPGLLLLAGLASCTSQPLAAPEPGLERMILQRKVEPFSPDPLREGADDASPASAMRTPPAGVVERQPLPRDPPPITHAGLEEGRETFGMVCAACHGPLGDGDSPVAQRMLLVRPRDLILDPILGYDRARLVQVMEQGYGLMPSVASQLTRDQRWEVAGYVKALQISRRSRLQDLPEDVRRQALRELP